MIPRTCRPKEVGSKDLSGGSFLRRFFADEHGATAIEYALLATFIAIAIIAAATQVGTATSGAYDRAAAGMQ
jgi:pilus assembly protein Flp/PilA